MNDYVYCLHICIVMPGKWNHRPSCILVDARQTRTEARDQLLCSTDSNLEITISKQSGIEQKRAFELQPLTFLATVSLH